MSIVRVDDGTIESSAGHRVAYEPTDQTVSGVLVDSIAAGRPVIATAFPHAVELPSGGADLIVPHGDQAALTEAVGAATQDGVLLREMTARARTLAPQHSWPVVAGRYVDEMTAVLRRHARAPV